MFIFVDFVGSATKASRRREHVPLAPARCSWGATFLMFCFVVYSDNFSILFLYCTGSHGRGGAQCSHADRATANAKWRRNVIVTSLWRHSTSSRQLRNLAPSDRLLLIRDRLFWWHSIAFVVCAPESFPNFFLDMNTTKTSPIPIYVFFG